jgi:hypothetical protein
MCSTASSTIKIVMKNIKPEIQLANKGPNSLGKKKSSKISFKKLKIKMQSN